jgi:hypothetical protein
LKMSASDYGSNIISSVTHFYNGASFRVDIDQ